MSTKSRAAVFLAAILSLSVTSTAFAAAESHTAAAAEATSEAAEIAEVENPVITSYVNNATMMYDCYFSDGATFSISSIPEEEGETVYLLSVDTEDPTIQVDISVNGVPVEYTMGSVITSSGLYDVKITHTMEDGSPVILNYSYNLTELGFIADEGTQSSSEPAITGRLVTEYVDGFFVYTFADGISQIRTNVLDGEIMNYPVALSMSENLHCSILRNGEVYSLPANGILTEDGAYSVTVQSSGGASGVEVRSLSFCIYSAAVSQITIFFPPVGYEISRVVSDNGDLSGLSADRYLLEKDGKYTIYYTNGMLTRSVDIDRDTTPPVLYFNGMTDAVYDTAVTVSASEPCSINVSRNGVVYDNVTLLGSSGFYQVTACDEAGNESSVRIEVTAASAIHPGNFIAVFIGIAVAAVVFFIVIKKQRPVVR